MTLKDLIAAVNEKGYRVSLHQYASNRWDASAMHTPASRPAGALYTHQSGFGSDPVEALEHLVASLDADQRNVKPEEAVPVTAPEDDYSDFV